MELTVIKEQPDKHKEQACSLCLSGCSPISPITVNATTIKTDQIIQIISRDELVPQWRKISPILIVKIIPLL